MSDGVTYRELRNINTEFSRLNLLLELCLLIHEIKSPELDLEDSHRQMMIAIQEKLSSGKPLEDENLDEMMNNLKAIRSGLCLWLHLSEICKANQLNESHYLQKHSKVC